MTHLTDTQIGQYAYSVGFRGAHLITAIAVALAESGGRTDAVNVEGNHPPSRDRGLWQINDHYHPEVPDSAAFDAHACAVAAYRISDHGANWSPWCTYTSGSYLKFMSRATIGARNATPAPIPAPSHYVLSRILKQGMSGNDVRTLQTALHITVDGTFGPVTRAAVIRYQQAHGLTADGVVGVHTCNSLGWRWAA